MDKKYLQFLIITVVFFIVYSYLLNKFYPQKPPQMAKPSGDTVSSKPQPIEYQEVTSEMLPVPPPAALKVLEVGDFTVTVSLTGGYIKSIYSERFDEELSFTNLGVTPDFNDKGFVLSQPTHNEIVMENKSEGVRKVWVFSGYSITQSITLPPGRHKVILVYNPFSTSMLNRRYQELFFKVTENTPFKRQALTKVKESSYARLWEVGLRDRYFAYVLYRGPYENITFFPYDKKGVLIASEVSNGRGEWTFYLGPQIPQELAPYRLSDTMSYGFFHGIGVVILKILRFFNAILHNWGLSIILLSVIIYLILFPFTMKSTQALKKMQALQPKLEELKKKYSDNPQKLQKETLELYRKYKINPLGGCLPLFFQFPVFIALYQVLFRFVELKGAHFLWIKDLTQPDRAFHLPFSLPFLGEYVNILPLIIILVSYLQQKVTPTSTDPQQKSMSMFFVVFIGIIFYQFPSSLVLYWLVQNILTFIYQYRMSKTQVALD